MKLFKTKEERELELKKKSLFDTLNSQLKGLPRNENYLWNVDKINELKNKIVNVKNKEEYDKFVIELKKYLREKHKKDFNVMKKLILGVLEVQKTVLENCSGLGVDITWSLDKINQLIEEVNTCNSIEDLNKIYDKSNKLKSELDEFVFNSRKNNILNGLQKMILDIDSDKSKSILFGLDTMKERLNELVLETEICHSLEEIDLMSKKVNAFGEEYKSHIEKASSNILKNNEKFFSEEARNDLKITNKKEELETRLEMLKIFADGYNENEIERIDSFYDELEGANTLCELNILEQKIDYFEKYNGYKEDNLITDFLDVVSKMEREENNYKKPR